ncbi:Retinal dehydrogenase 1 [Penicillium riverlandense]|uniref:Retinal dehydrogenase 1 n=1 Tax=Penicillium riverlandense TaxID=1903569 RepID=UPI00254938C5|nr:Retinal dehydrogenase 1 [Penicillium riverlandense]KAJ5825150.1 Retinal dehydrogenase 1 [Penicillium riverlandense]
MSTIVQNPKTKSLETRLFINGKFVDASDGGKFDLISPSTGEKFVEVSEATEQDTNAAVAAAKAAFPAWSALSPQQRGVYFKKLAALIRESHDELAELEALSMGRPVSAYFESFVAAQTLDHFSEAGYQAMGTSSLNSNGYVNMTMRQPYGVVGAIIPWNVPVGFLINKSAPALIAGNTIVVKSSEKAPLTSAKVATLIEKVGFPPGVFNIISGHGPVSGSVLSHHMDVRVLSFTGSSRTGRLIQEAAAKSNLKNILLELGGKSPAIIFPDCNIDKAVRQTKFSIQFNSGQTCMGNSRIYVHEAIADTFLEKFHKAFVVESGDPLLPGTNHGPQADVLQYNQVQKYIEEGKKVAKMTLGEVPIGHKNGFFVQPTVFVNTPEDAKIMKEEIFGPVVCINTFSSEDEVIAKANDTEYGLYAAVYTKDISRALRMAKKLEAGSVGVNCTSPTNFPDMPFGGYKASGIGREGWNECLDHFLETKAVMIEVDDE